MGQSPAEASGAQAVTRLLPGLVAAALALIYLVGSLNAAGSFARDDISVAAVRLLSLEQILVRGVSVLTQPMVLIALAVVMLGFYFGPQQQPKRKNGISRRPTRLLGRLGLMSLTAPWFIVGFLATLLFSWRLGVIVLVFPLSLLVENSLPAPRDLDGLKRRVRLFTAGTGLIVFLACAYFGAFVQPLATYETNTPIPKESGVLVTHTDGTWYVATAKSKGQSIEAISDQEMRNVELTYRATSPGESLLSVFGHALG